MENQQLSREKAEELAAAILAVDGVQGLYGGRYGEIAMLFAGGKVAGVHLYTSRGETTPTRLEVSLVVDGSLDLPNLETLADNVRTVAEGYTQLPVDVTIADVA